MTTHDEPSRPHRDVEPDDRIRREVLDELAWDSHTSAFAIGVAVDHGVVTLTGTVDSYVQKHAAEAAAHRMAGVLDVANEIHVDVPREHVRSDAGIARAVRHALEWDVMVPDSRIESAVSDGFVTLTGTVNLLREREDAAGAIRQLTGVRGVSNHITVAPANITARELRRAIEDALARRAQREARHIGVTVHDGVVSLKGRVHSWEERQAILGAVGHARGITAVDDQIRVDPCV